MGSRILCALAIVAAMGCSRRPETSPASTATPKAPTWSGLDQGWSDDEKDQFWFTSQGSWLVPYRWFLVLEDADNETLLRDDATLGGLGYLTAAASARNPDGLPIGFVKDSHKTTEPQMLGFTCAACHTTRLEWGGKSVQVEGGPALADFEGFLDALVASLEATVKDPQKFERFSRKVVGEASGSKATALRTDLERFTADLLARDVRNHPPHPYGRARVDALGNILNEVLAVDLGVAENARPADAPVSYPVMWDAHQHDFVQWNGSAPNAGPGPVLRNIGEVLGVFGHMEFTPRKGRFAVYKTSSVDAESLKQLEVLVEKLQSPLWPSSFPAVDPGKVKAGQVLHQTHCESCHPPIKRDDPNRRIKAHMVEVSKVGTDPVAATGFVERKAKTGPLKGTPVFVNLAETFGETAGAAEILRNAVFGVGLGQFHLGVPHPQPAVLPPGGPHKALEEHWLALEQKVKDQATALKTLVAGNPKQLTVPMYKARPHNGVWASAPYLHNGSVLTLSELLKKPEDRAKTFYVGSRQYDPENVGLKDVPEEGGVRYFSFDTSLRGNSNAGHPFGTELKDEEKRQLLEYLKTL